MAYRAEVICDSLSPEGIRLTTLSIRFPRIILAELNTHRMLSKSAASSRAIPVKRMIEMVEADPFIPEVWGSNKAGMQAGEEVSDDQALAATESWKIAIRNAITWAKDLAGYNIHKQHVNRLLEPFSWTSVVITGTDWKNFFNLRDSNLAQPEMQKIAGLMREAMEASQPSNLLYSQWHLPYISEEEKNSPILPEDLRKYSAARCARVSYRDFDGNIDLIKDLRLSSQLLADKHMTPFEHQAKPGSSEVYYGNFRGWRQARKFIPGESGQ